MFFNPGILKAQDIYTIQGKIVDSSSNEGIEYVCVGIIGKDVGTIANEMGFYNLKIPG